MSSRSLIELPDAAIQRLKSELKTTDEFDEDDKIATARTELLMNKFATFYNRQGVKTGPEKLSSSELLLYVKNNDKSLLANGSKTATETTSAIALVKNARTFTVTFRPWYTPWNLEMMNEAIRQLSPHLSNIEWREDFTDGNSMVLVITLIKTQWRQATAPVIFVAPLRPIALKRIDIVISEHLKFFSEDAKLVQNTVALLHNSHMEIPYDIKVLDVRERETEHLTRTSVHRKIQRMRGVLADQTLVNPDGSPLIHKERTLAIEVGPLFKIDLAFFDTLARQLGARLQNIKILKREIPNPMVEETELSKHKKLIVIVSLHHNDDTMRLTKEAPLLYTKSALLPRTNPLVMRDLMTPIKQTGVKRKLEQ